MGFTTLCEGDLLAPFSIGSKRCGRRPFMVRLALLLALLDIAGWELYEFCGWFRDCCWEAGGFCMGGKEFLAKGGELELICVLDEVDWIVGEGVLFIDEICGACWWACNLDWDWDCGLATGFAACGWGVDLLACSEGDRLSCWPFPLCCCCSVREEAFDLTWLSLTSWSIRSRVDSTNSRLALDLVSLAIFERSKQQRKTPKVESLVVIQSPGQESKSPSKSRLMQGDKLSRLTNVESSRRQEKSRKGHNSHKTTSHNMIAFKRAATAQQNLLSLWLQKQNKEPTRRRRKKLHANRPSKSRYFSHSESGPAAPHTLFSQFFSQLLPMQKIGVTWRLYFFSIQPTNQHNERKPSTFSGQSEQELATTEWDKRERKSN